MTNYIRICGRSLITTFMEIPFCEPGALDPHDFRPASEASTLQPFQEKRSAKEGIMASTLRITHRPGSGD
ncbi:MAG: hypothetical protein O7E52_27825, partial [Candidatus Poribacteria bacterium]|nr:hypothetical protein [Candidatus Poribacteria bacterium]